MFNKEDYFKIIDFVLKESAGYDTRVLVINQTEGLTRFANSEIHQNVQTTITGVEIIITEKNKRSKINTSIYTEDGLRTAVKEVIDNLKYLPEGEPEPPLVTPTENIVHIEIKSDLKKEFSIENRATYVKNGIANLGSGYEAFGALSYVEYITAFGNSRGVRHISGSNKVDFSVLVTHGDNDTGYAALTSNRLEDLNIPEAFSRAYQKAQLNKDSKTIEPGAYTVILEPLAVGEILTYLSFIGFSGKSIQDQASFLTGKLQQKVFADKVTIVDDHTNPNTISLPFDFEGTKRQKVNIIENGIAKELIYDLATATKDAVKSTGHSINSPSMGGLPLNIIMEPGTESLADIIKNIENGLLVTRFHYINVVNPRLAQLTGLTRDGLFQIKDGKITGAIKNMRFTESILEAFSNVETISKERERTSGFISNYYVPALKINNFHFTSKTELASGKA